MTPIRRPVANPYVRLGLAPGASLAEVKRTYRRLAMHVHPDRAGSGSLQTFLEVKAAYEWIVAHRSLAGSVAELGDRRPGSVPRTTVARPVRRAAPTMAAPPAHSPAARSSWPGGRWYWEGLTAGRPSRLR